MDSRTLSRTGTPPRSEPRNVPQLLRVFECESPRSPGARHFLEGLEGVLLGRGPEHEVHRDGAVLRIRVPDPRMSA